MQVVVFSLGSDSYAVDALTVQEILRRPQYTALPESPRHILGMMDFRGVSIPLVHLGHMLSVSAIEEGERAIVLSDGGFTCAFLVDDVSDVFAIADNAIDTVPQVVSGAHSVPKAIARVKDKHIIIVDPVKLLHRSQELFE